MRPFCEVVVNEILPAVRSMLAKELKDSGMTQEQIAEALGITQASVSYYLRQARGKNVEMLEKSASLKKKLTAERIKAKKANTALDFCGICKEVRKEVICGFHKKSNPALESCNMCFRGV
jgi:predicted transcriptional regulator